MNGFYPYEYMSPFKSLKKHFPVKKSIIVPWPVKKLVTMNINMLLRFGIYLEWKKWMIIMACCSNVIFLIISWSFWKG